MLLKNIVGRFPRKFLDRWIHGQGIDVKKTFFYVFILNKKRVFNFFIFGTFRQNKNVDNSNVPVSKLSA